MKNLDFLKQQPDYALSNVAEDPVHLSVQSIEAWLIADLESLSRYYGQGFRKNVLPKRPVEDISPAESLKGLEQATAKTKKGTYHKTKHLPDLLKQVDPLKVREVAPRCKQLFETLEAKIAATP